MVRKPRFFAIAINERPTPEFAPFWTIQSPGFRSAYSLRISAAVGGLPRQRREPAGTHELQLR
jgi:hypothetical protein